MQLEPNRGRKRDIFISASQISFASKWSAIKISEDFVSFGEFLETALWYDNIIEDENFSFSNIYFRASSKRRVYSLEPYNIIELLGDMGGLLDIAYAFGILCTASIAT